MPTPCWELPEGPKLCPLSQACAFLDSRALAEAAFIEVNGMQLLDEKHLQSRGSISRVFLIPFDRSTELADPAAGL